MEVVACPMVINLSKKRGRKPQILKEKKKSLMKIYILKI